MIYFLIFVLFVIWILIFVLGGIEHIERKREMKKIGREYRARGIYTYEEIDEMEKATNEPRAGIDSYDPMYGNGDLDD